MMQSVFVSDNGSELQNKIRPNLHPSMQESLPITIGTDISLYLMNVYEYNVYSS